MTHRAPYRAKSITGAQARVRRLERQRAELLALLERYARERRLLARLAADTPQFDNPIVVAEAQEIRDRILASLRGKAQSPAGESAGRRGDPTR